MLNVFIIYYYIAMIIWYKVVVLPALFNFTNKDDEIPGLTRGNAYYFFTFFFIPIIPLFFKESVWVASNGTYYKRKISLWWGAVNHFLPWIILWLICVVISVIEEISR